MDVFLQLLLTGICIGAVYGLGALGFVLIYKASSVFNLGHGPLMMMGAFLMYTTFAQQGLGIVLSLVITIVASAVVGYVIEFVLIRPMTGQPLFAIMIITIAIMYVVRGSVYLVWGPSTYGYPQMLPIGSVEIGGAYVAAEYIAGFLLAMVAIGLFILYFRLTKTGLAMRAAAEDGLLCESMGVPVRNITGIAWALATAMAAIGGIVLGMLTSVNWLLDEVGMKVLPVVIFGGLDSIIGAIAGGLIVGVVTNIAGGYLESLLPSFKEIAPFVVMLMVLLVRPDGLLGEKRIERV